MKRASIVLLFLLAACGSNRATPTVTCGATQLKPSYVPSGLHRTTKAALVPSRWNSTWTGGGRTVQVDGGVNADLGDGPDIKSAVVRGHTAQYGPTGNPDGPLAVEWSEGKRCPASYAVIVNGITATEMLRIANSLR